MKLFYILLISTLIMITSCRDYPVQIVDAPKDTLRDIQITNNLPKSNFISDRDTLKIEILDSTIASFNNFQDLLFVYGVTLGNKFTNNRIFELITKDIFIKINPKNKNEIWFYGFNANLDSTRHFSVGKFDYYRLTLTFSNINPYYVDKVIGFYVESTTE